MINNVSYIPRLPLPDFLPESGLLGDRAGDLLSFAEPLDPDRLAEPKDGQVK